MRRVLLTLLLIFNFSSAEDVVVGAEDFDSYLPLLKGKRVALVVNHTSLIGDRHLLYFLLDNNINVVKVFAPEHGFRGILDAGESVSDGEDGMRNIKLYHYNG